MTAELKEMVDLLVVENFVNSLADFKGAKVFHVDGGVSTAVYRLNKNGEAFYLRLGSGGENASSEVLAHKLMSERGVRVPEILVWEDENQMIGRSFMITSEIKGERIDEDEMAKGDTYQEAGRQLALINSIPLGKFGWMDRQKKDVGKLEGRCESWKDFALDMDNFGAMLADLTAVGVWGEGEVEKILKYVDARSDLIDCTQGFLAHGDFCPGHIYSEQGRYSGMIDFGDIRVTSQFHDLGHYYTYARKSFYDLLAGYREINDLGENYMEKIKLIALVFGIGKMWWVAKNLPGQLKIRKSVIRVVEEEVGR